MRRHSSPSHPWTIIGKLAACSALFISAAGCTGGGRAWMVPVFRGDLPPGSPLVQEVRPGEAYWWVNDDGRLSIAMRWESRSLLGPAFDAQWEMSIVLEGLPAGAERLYSVRSETARMLQARGGEHQRFRSNNGIAVVEAGRGRRLTGRFHCLGNQQTFSVFTGWTGGPMVVLAGTFEAVENRARGEPILRQTEAEGMARRFPATRPAPRR